MGLTCGAQMLKFLLVSFNFIFFIAGVGCIVLGVGILILKGEFISGISETGLEKNIENDENKTELNDLFTNLGILLSVVGAIVLFVSFLGCFGALKEWRLFLIAYSMCLMLILALEIAIAILSATSGNSIKEKVKRAMKTSLKMYPKSDKAKKAWNKMMDDNKCCGVVSGEAMDEFKSLNMTELPGHCCPLDKRTADTCKQRSAYKQGCYDALQSWFGRGLTGALGLGIGIALLLLVGILFALCLCQSISDDDD